MKTTLGLVCSLWVVGVLGETPDIGPDGGPYHESVDLESDWDPYGAPDSSNTDVFTTEGECEKEDTGGIHEEHPDMHLTLPEIVMKYGYDFEEHKVVTEDGYILGIQRIKGSRISPWRAGKRPVYLHHGLMGSALVWLMLYENNSLALKLANAGYDVFLGNVRGNSYSQGHTTLANNSDEYWDFGWNESGMLDLPAVIDHILLVTGERKTYYIGHSMGCTQFMVCMSLRPEYGRKIHVGFLLAPVGHFGTITNPLFRTVFSHGQPYKENWKSEFGNFLDARKSVAAFSGGKECSQSTLKCGVCDNSLYAAMGFDGLEMNKTVTPFFSGRSGDIAATGQLVHFSQSVVFDTFRPYLYPDMYRNMQAYQAATPPPYPLERINAPTVTFWGSGDTVAEPTSIKKTLKLFSPGIIKENNRVPLAAFGHMDFLTAIHVQKYIYNRIQWIMDQHLYLDP